MAHIMLPGKAPDKYEENNLKFAENAINELLLQLSVPPEKFNDINICLLGAGNVLKREDDTICTNITRSVQEILAQKKLIIEAKDIGGTARRSVNFYIGKGEIYFTVDNSREILLWKNNESN